MADFGDDGEYSRGPKRIKLAATNGFLQADEEMEGIKSKTGPDGLSPSARQKALDLLQDLFDASRRIRPHTNTDVDSDTKINIRGPPAETGLVTPSPTLSNHAQAGEDGSPQPKRHVSGPGEFTPRALLKSEEEFENIGIDAGAVLALHGDGISWWLAEQVIRIHQYLENPQKGRPTSLDARPRGRIKAASGSGSGSGREVNHCCPKGGITHLKPCNMSRAPPASEAFPFALQMRDSLLPQHHASKGGINTIAFVGDIVLEKLAGCSRIEEEEFKLVAGSEHIRNFFGRGYRRYKSSDPHIDPTKQPILLLKSLKKASQSEALVAQLKTRYVWALENYQGLVGLPSPGNQLLPFAAVSSGTAVSNARVTPVKLAPAVKSGSASAKQDIQHPAVLPASNPSAYATPSQIRGSMKPEFPLLGLSISDSAYASRVIFEICDLLAIIFQGPPSNDANSGFALSQPQTTPNKANSSQSSERKRRHSAKRRSIEEGADLLLTLANGGPFKRDTESQSNRGLPDFAPATAEEMPEPFCLETRLRMDHVLKVLVEGVVNAHIERQRDVPGASAKDMRNLKGQLGHLKHLFGLADLRCNVVVTPQHSAAILRLFRTLLDQTRPENAGGSIQSSVHGRHRRHVGNSGSRNDDDDEDDGDDEDNVS